MNKLYFTTLVVIIASVTYHGRAFKIEITHFNDVSAQIESFVNGTSNSSKAPTPCPKNGELNCIGGLVNIVQHLNEKYDAGDIPRLTIISGNVIGGESGWISARQDNNGWKAYASEIVRDHFKPDVVALGMKEFGAGVPRATDFVNVVRNVTLSNTCLKTYSGDEATFCDEKLVPKIKVITLADDNHVNFDIGIVGFVTPTVERLSIPGKLEFGDVVSSVQKVVDANSNIKTFIAVGDGNLNMAKQIIEKIPKVKLVVYGSGLSNTQDMTGKYPLQHINGYIVTAGRYGSSIGKLLIDIDSTTGNIKSANGKIIPTTRSDPLNEPAQAALKTYTQSWLVSVNNTKENLVGHTRVTLQGGENCWRQECNLGNLMTDAAVHCALQLPSKPFPFHIHSVWHGGAFFEDKIDAGRSISEFDIHKWLPYHNRAHLVQITGADLWALFEESVKGVDPQKAGVNDWRQFLQVSNGLEVYIDTKSEGSPKLQALRMTHDNNGVPALANIDKSKTYYFVIPTYLYEGRGVYGFIAGKWKDVNFDNVTNSNIGFDDVCLQQYVTALWQVQVGFEERIWINADPDDRPSSDCPGKKTGVTVILTIVFFSLFLAIIYVGYYYVVPRLRRQPEFYPRNQE